MHSLSIYWETSLGAAEPNAKNLTSEIVLHSRRKHRPWRKMYEFERINRATAARGCNQYTRFPPRRTATQDQYLRSGGCSESNHCLLSELESVINLDSKVPGMISIGIRNSSQMFIHHSAGTERPASPGVRHRPPRCQGTPDRRKSPAGVPRYSPVPSGCPCACFRYPVPEGCCECRG